MYNEYNEYDRQGYAAQPALSYSGFMSRTFRWMACGLLLTFAVAYTIAYTGLINQVAQLYLPLTIAELAMVFVLSSRVQHLQVGTARALFLGYSALNGLVLSIYFALFDVSSLVLAFLASALYFGIMAVYGARTRSNLMSWGPALTAALVALLVCSFVGMLFGMGFLASMLYSAIGLGIFMLLTARDTQMLQGYYQYYSGDDAMLEKSAIFGALSLYLDFINVFLFVLRFMGNRRSD